MKVIAKQNRELLLINAQNTQNENRAETITLTVPEEYEDYNKKIVFITPNETVWDIIQSNTYKITNAITQYKEVDFYIWLTKEVDGETIDFRSKTKPLKFFHNKDASDEITNEEIHGVNTVVNLLEEEITKVEGLEDDVRDLITDIQNRLDNGDFKGEKGDKGDPGEKGEPGATPDVSMFVTKDVDNLTYYTNSADMQIAIDGAVSTETTNRQNADNNLQSQIDAITVSSDVVDVVSTYTDLQNYDTTKLTDKDVIKVLQDSTHNSALSYYRWVVTNSVGAWTYLGSEGPFYTKSESDILLIHKPNMYYIDSTKVESDDSPSPSTDYTKWQNTGIKAGDWVYSGDYYYALANMKNCFSLYRVSGINELTNKISFTPISKNSIGRPQNPISDYIDGQTMSDDPIDVTLPVGTVWVNYLTNRIWVLVDYEDREATQPEMEYVWKEITTLPEVTPADAGKVLTVGSNGSWTVLPSTGTTYTAGDSIKIQNNEISVTTDRQYKTLTPTWVQGSITSEGYNMDSTTRIRTDYVLVSKGAKVSLLNTTSYKFSVYTYTLDTQAKIDEITGGWCQLSSITVNYDCYIKVVMAHSNNATASTDISQYIKIQSMKETTLSKMYEERFDVPDLTWEVGTLDGTTGQPSIRGDRARTRDYVLINKGDTIDMKIQTDSLKIAFHYFDANKNHTGGSSWYTTDTKWECTYDGYIKMVGGATNDAAITNELLEKIKNSTIVTNSRLNSIEQRLDIAEESEKNIELNTQNIVNILANVKSVNHRGYNTIAPENTLSAYRLSKKAGFYYVETDVSFTSDNVPVLLHDDTIDRTSNGTGSINSMTFAQVRQYDFGSWKSSDYAGEKIPSLEEFISLCKNIGLHPYIELKMGYTQAQIESCVQIVKNYGMLRDVTWISFSSTYLGYVKGVDSKARLGYLTDTITSTVISAATGLKNSENEVYIGANYTYLTSETIQLCKNASIPLEVWTVDSRSTIEGMNKYITGVTSNILLANNILFDNSSDIAGIPAYERLIAQDILQAKQDVITSSNKLSSDFIDDTNKTNKFVTSAEKTTWNNKQDKSRKKSWKTIRTITVPSDTYINQTINGVTYSGNVNNGIKKILFKTDSSGNTLKGHQITSIAIKLTPVSAININQGFIELINSSDIASAVQYFTGIKNLTSLTARYFIIPIDAIAISNLSTLGASYNYNITNIDEICGISFYGHEDSSTLGEGTVLKFKAYGYWDD